MPNTDAYQIAAVDDLLPELKQVRYIYHVNIEYDLTLELRIFKGTNWGYLKDQMPVAENSQWYIVWWREINNKS